jgi:2-phosphosulfolactate phosphatase
MAHKIEVCLSPILYSKFHNPEAVVIVTDVLRASSAICTAFWNGVNELIPVESLEEARDFKNKGYIVAAERDGIKMDFADFGNSPYNFTRVTVGGKSIVYSTTNGTEAIHQASGSFKVVIGAFLNLSSSCEYLHYLNRDVIVLCAGWKDKINLEDTVHAGAIVEQMTENYSFRTSCDSALAALDLWKIAKTDLSGYLQKCAQRSRLKKNQLDDVIDYCLTPDLTPVVPELNGMRLVVAQRKENEHV